MVSSAPQDLWWTMGFGLATTLIYTGVSILLTDSALSFLPNLDAFPSSPCTRQILDVRYAHSENWKNIFLNVCRDGVEISHKTPETQFTINDSHIRWARGQSILLGLAGLGWAQTRVSLPIMWAASATAPGFFVLAYQIINLHAVVRAISCKNNT